MDLAGHLAHLPVLVGGGWVVRFPPISREEGHEAITREAWAGLGLTVEQQRALLRGVRAPDMSLGLLTSAVPFVQRRHALRAWSATTTAEGVRAVREFLITRHRHALALPDGARRWATFAIR